MTALRQRHLPDKFGADASVNTKGSTYPVVIASENASWHRIDIIFILNSQAVHWHHD